MAEVPDLEDLAALGDSAAGATRLLQAHVKRVAKAQPAAHSGGETPAAGTGGGGGGGAVPGAPCLCMPDAGNLCIVA